mgnify:CR=1 FL=1
MTRRFGNTPATLRGGFVVMAILGAITGGIGSAAAYAHGTLPGTFPVMTLLFLGPMVAFALGVLPTLAVSIQLDGLRVRHVLFGRFVLSDFDAAGFVRMETLCGPFGAVLHFEGGRAIRFLGAHLGIISKLRHELESMKHEARPPSRQKCLPSSPT